jgi:hypothetical protein
LTISPQLGAPVWKSSFYIARRIERNGQFHGVASIAIPVDKLGEFWSSMSLGPDSSVGVIRSDGWLVARYPSLETALNLSKNPLFTTHLPRKSSGFYHNATSAADGVARIVGYWQVED